MCIVVTFYISSLACLLCVLCDFCFNVLVMILARRFLFVFVLLHSPFCFHISSSFDVYDLCSLCFSLQCVCWNFYCKGFYIFLHSRQQLFFFFEIWQPLLLLCSYISGSHLHYGLIVLLLLHFYFLLHFLFLFILLFLMFDYVQMWVRIIVVYHYYVSFSFFISFLASIEVFKIFNLISNHTPFLIYYRMPIRKFLWKICCQHTHMLDPIFDPQIIFN